MGIEYYVACHQCKTIKHLDKNLGPEDVVQHKALAGFMQSHLGHTCVLTCDLDDDMPEGYKEVEK